jgi:large subunit ribosomal protein L6
MSRIGKKPITVPSGVKVNIADGVVVVEGKAKLSTKIPPLVAVELEDNNIVVKRLDEDRSSSAMQGLARSLINNMIVGVTEGYKKQLQVIGVGFRAQVSGKKLTLNLGFSHPIEFAIPEGISVSVNNNTEIIVEGADKQAVGQAAATIRAFRKPEPYKGKGIRYADEQVQIKEGKSVG